MQGQVTAFNGADEWIANAEGLSPSLIIIGVSSYAEEANAVRKQLLLIKQMHIDIPVVLLCDTETTEEILIAIEMGARGFIPMSLPLSVAIQAMRLVMAGGVYVPVSGLSTVRRSGEQPHQADHQNHPFTARQTAIVRALCRGKPNKVIAYELNMCESTVKVHVRNIMKKLKAKNRTEVAVMANALLREPMESGLHIAASPVALS
jgi:DNA-binding NarL/FixJ family response regulator